MVEALLNSGAIGIVISSEFAEKSLSWRNLRNLFMWEMWMGDSIGKDQ